MKITIIGAGSSYTPEIVEKIVEKQADLGVSELCLMDTDEGRLGVMHGFCIRFAAHLKGAFKITKTDKLESAISGAHFIIIQIRVGGNQARYYDERIPLSYNLIGQETTGAGGFMKALRTIPQLLKIAKTVEEVNPNAWIINYTNPSGIVTEGVTKHSKAKFVGLCSGGLFPRNWVAEALDVPPETVSYDFFGLNHLNFGYNLKVNGRPLTKEEFSTTADAHCSVEPKLIKSLGLLPSPYLQYFFHKRKSLAKLQDAKQLRSEEVQALEGDVFRELADPLQYEKPPTLIKRGGGGYSEVAIGIIESLHNNIPRRMVANVANANTVPFLSPDAVIETTCLVSSHGITPLAQPNIPNSVKGIICAVKTYEELTVKAAITGCYDTALHALLNNPLVGDYDTAEKVLNEMLEKNSTYLPLFRA